MPAYRIYFFRNGGHIFKAMVAECASDADALATATRLQQQEDESVEVWEGARMAGRVEAQHQPPLGSPNFPHDRAR
jgi:hypothetical protein